MHSNAVHIDVNKNMYLHIPGISPCHSSIASSIFSTCLYQKFRLCNFFLSFVFVFLWGEKYSRGQTGLLYRHRHKIDAVVIWDKRSEARKCMIHPQYNERIGDVIAPPIFLLRMEAAGRRRNDISSGRNVVVFGSHQVFDKIIMFRVEAEEIIHDNQ